MHLVGSVGKRMLYEVIDALDDAAGDHITFRITSHGGDPDTALAIVGLMQSYNGTITTEVYGYCYSAATLLFAAGSRRRMQKYSWVMVHEASEAVDGTATALKHRAKTMERAEGHWNSIMHDLTGTDAKVWEKLNERDTYLNADECLKLNLATEIF